MKTIFLNLLAVILITLFLVSCAKKESTEDTLKYGACESAIFTSEGNAFMCYDNQLVDGCNSGTDVQKYWHENKSCAELGYAYNSGAAWYVGQGQTNVSGQYGHWPEYYHPPVVYGSFTDPRDGNTYKTVKIGNQTWMAENLRSSKYRDGTSIVNAESNNAWITDQTGAWCWYNNNQSYDEPLWSGDIPYGKLYNWYAVNNFRGLAPVGWHVPTHSEWLLLIDYLGGMTVASDKLKDSGTIHWIYNGPHYGTNETGFTALPAGYRSSLDGHFSYFGGLTSWWTSTENNTAEAMYVTMVNYLGSGEGYKNDGASIRCLKN